MAATVPRTGAPLPTRPNPGPRRGSATAGRRRRLASLALAVEIAALVAVLGTGAAGFAPWSIVAPASHPSTSSSSGVAFTSARSAADVAAAATPNGPWVLEAGIGLDVPVAYTVPIVSTSTAPLGDYPYSCALAPIASGGPGTLTVPATASSDRGLSAAWFLEYRSSAGGTLLVTVFNGSASSVAVASGPGCPNYYPTSLNLSGGLLDSTSVAAIVNSWGGSAFAGNHSGLISAWMVTAPFPYYGGGVYAVGGTAGGAGTNPGGTTTGGPKGNGSTGPSPSPPPLPAPNFLPPAWSVDYLATGGSGGLANGSSFPSATLSATVDARNGSLLDLTVVNGSFYFGYGPGYGTPSVPPTGAGSSVFGAPPTGGAALGSSGSSNGVAGPSSGAAAPAPWDPPSSSSAASGPSTPGSSPSARSTGLSSLAVRGLPGPLLLLVLVATLAAAVAATWRIGRRGPTSPTPLGPIDPAPPAGPLDDVL